MFALVVLAIQLLTAQGNEAFTYSLNGAQQSGYIVIDQEWRGNNTPTADVKLSDAGVTVSGNTVSQKFKTGMNVGSRIYILAPGGKAYEKFKLVNSELTFDVDISQIPCGMNAAIYTAEMPADGVTPGHEAGAAYGGGYCDANYVGGIGCAEFDIGESNARATVYTSHGCNPTTGFARQGSISCDTGGTGANPYRQNKNFYGNGSSFTVNTASKFTVVTQFKGSGQLTSIDRIYIQNGQKIPQPNNINNNLNQISPSLAAGHVLIFSIWASDGDMSWMDCNDNGPCNAGQESSNYLQQNYPNATVTYSNIRWGGIDTTY
uniref:cellulose 1,4-beta-cellobiosidase (non-reducing end) n=1 Tax=uncultured symbiotic protist of Reticulitermes speratus TaxID=403658 RepID=A4UWN8_9EUKA|nr:putative glycosyl hydrolase family7 [uncultured symbiotic protist of Reticulitermes speratus]